MTTTHKHITFLAAMLLLLSVAACGHDPGERALSGAGIGAGTGAVAGAIMGSPGTGAILGGAVGAAAGGLTSDRDIDLGKPIWE